jgi:CTP:phosphocholine cytidylyltransferase-like protein
MVSKKVFEILANIAENETSDVISDRTAMDELLQAGFYKKSSITEKGFALLNAHKIDNAVILAAGLSSRFVPVSFDKPKGLLEVKGEVLVERQIRQLIEKGINEIFIVIGYKKEQFYYLKDKYNIKLIETNDYLVKNNHSSVFAARKYLKNTIITSSDLYFAKNLFQRYAYDSYYCSIFIEGNTDERGLVIDDSDKIVNTYYNCHDTWVSLGYAFFSKKFSEKYIEIVENIIDDQRTYNKFWADIQDDYLSDLYMYIKRCNKNDIYEFDSLQELYDFQIDFKGIMFSESLGYICSVLKCDERELYKFTPIAVKGILNICSFRYLKNLYYFCSYSEQFIDINEIYKVIQKLKFKFTNLDIDKNRAILRIQEEFND